MGEHQHGGTDAPECETCQHSMTAAPGTRGTLADVIHRHLPKDRYDEEGNPVGTYCTGCEWEGDYFADGEAGPFDDHLAAAVLTWLADALADEGTVEAVARAESLHRWSAEHRWSRTFQGYESRCSCGEWTRDPRIHRADRALAALRERLGVDGGEEVGG